MSVSIVALPYAIAWAISSAVISSAEKVESLQKSNNEKLVDNYVKEFEKEAECHEFHMITEKNVINKTFETIFMDKEILLKTLEEHGVKILEEEEWNKNRVRGIIDEYSFDFDREDTAKPYSLTIRYNEKSDLQDKLESLNSEYTLNVQEDAYLNIVEKLNDNNMEIENEEVLDDNTIVLTINLE